MQKAEYGAGDTSWFTHDRFGLFIHWGLYALPARHEWIQHLESQTREQYQRYFERFDPDLYDPASWARAASGAGMKYFVVTTKHHEGFCLWDSKLTDYKAPNTPASRDLLRPMVDAFREQNMRVGFYHSLIDWHHPQYHIDPYIGPYRKHPEREQMNRVRSQRAYTDHLHGQVRELLTEFGQVDILWLDFSFPGRGPEGKGREDWRSADLATMVRELMPEVILNDRLDLPSSADVRTPEQIQPREWVTFEGKRCVWEACQTFSGSWGYHRDEASWKSVEQLLHMLIDTVGKGGNLLLNVGPTGRGEFDERALERLSGMGEWMKRHSRSIYGCTAAPRWAKVPRDCRLTYNPATRRVYVHVFAWPFKHLHLDGFGGRIEYAQLLDDASEIKAAGIPDWQAAYVAKDEARTVTLELPVQKPNVTVPVIELFLK